MQPMTRPQCQPTLSHSYCWCHISLESYWFFYVLTFFSKTFFFQRHLREYAASTREYSRVRGSRVKLFFALKHCTGRADCTFHATPLREYAASTREYSFHRFVGFSFFFWIFFSILLNRCVISFGADHLYSVAVF